MKRCIMLHLINACLELFIYHSRQTRQGLGLFLLQRSIANHLSSLPYSLCCAFQILKVVIMHFPYGRWNCVTDTYITVNCLDDEYSLLSVSPNTVARVGVACDWLIGQSTLARGRALTNHNFSELMVGKCRWRQLQQPTDALQFQQSIDSRKHATSQRQTVPVLHCLM